VLVNTLATKANLEKREITVEGSMCSLCGVVEETSTHLFFECRFVWVLWNQCCVWLGVQNVLHNDPLLNFSQFRMCNASASVNEVWAVIWIVVVNEIWKHRNNVIFKGEGNRCIGSVCFGSTLCLVLGYIQVTFCAFFLLWLVPCSFGLHWDDLMMYFFRCMNESLRRFFPRFR